MKKQLFFAALALTALAGCTEDSFVGDQSPQKQIDEGAITFGTGFKAVTRGEGADAADLLNKNFVVFGYKGSDQKVFDNYQVNYVAETSNTTESNSAGWEYVSYKNLPFGTKMATADELNDRGITANATGSSTNIIQSIKYWDFNASTYDFFAYSLGTGEDDSNDEDTDRQYAKASAMALTGHGSGSSSPGYTLSGSQAELGHCYISKNKHLASPWSTPPTTEVDLEFVNFLSKIQLKFYETIPGYAVKELKFYYDASNKTQGTASGDGLKPALYTASTIPTGGTYDISFDASYNPVVTLSSSSSTATKVEFDAISSGVWLNSYASTLDYHEAASAGVFLARESTNATSSKQITVLPNSTGATLTLKMDYTLVSRDGSGENIQVTGATATIPASYTAWKPNYAYTYVFKISDNTNGTTGSIIGLYPITLDAVVTETVNGTQETITTVSTPSITTYAKASDVTVDNEYKTGANIYIVVNEGTALTVETNANLYTAVVEDGAAQGITEETVKNAIATNSDGYGIGVVLTSGTDVTSYFTYSEGTYTSATGTADGTTTYYPDADYSVKDANGKKLVVNNAAESLTAFTGIPAADTPDGIAIADIKGAKFTPASAGYYVFEYTDGSSNKHYKVIKVVD